MTGFGQAEGRIGNLWVRVEIKTVNHRSMDFGFSLPPGWDSLEGVLRQEVTKVLQRGKVWIRIYATPLSISIDDLSLEPLASVVHHMREMGIQPVMDVGALLQTISTAVRPIPNTDRLLRLFRSALGELVKSRKEEGKRLKAIFVDGLQSLRRGIHKARQLKTQEIQRLEDRLKENPSVLNASAQSADLYLRIRKEIEGEEELARLEAHWKALDETLRSPGPKGRRVEFLLQEFHREWTTLAHKSGLSDLVHLTIDMRETVDQLKEQARNVE